MKTSFLFRHHSGISRLVTSHLLVMGLAFGAYATLPAFVAPAQAQPAPAINVGVVDDDLLSDGDKKFQNAVAALQKRADDLDTKIPAREFLSDDEGKTFDTLMVKDKLTPAETTQLDTAVKAGMDKRAEYISLNGKVNRVDSDNARLKTLQDSSGKNGGALRDLSQKLDTMIRGQLSTLKEEYFNRADSVVAQVANDKKLVIVVRKSAALWASPTLDITTEVMKRLNAAS